jgi:hypothetical protein
LNSTEIDLNDAVFLLKCLFGRIIEEIAKSRPLEDLYEKVMTAAPSDDESPRCLEPLLLSLVDLLDKLDKSDQVFRNKNWNVFLFEHWGTTVDGCNISSKELPEAVSELMNIVMDGSTRSMSLNDLRTSLHHAADLIGNKNSIMFQFLDSLAIQIALVDLERAILGTLCHNVMTKAADIDDPMRDFLRELFRWLKKTIQQMTEGQVDFDNLFGRVSSKATFLGKQYFGDAGILIQSFDSLIEKIKSFDSSSLVSEEIEQNLCENLGLVRLEISISFMDDSKRFIAFLFAALMRVVLLVELEKRACRASATLCDKLKNAAEFGWKECIRIGLRLLEIAREKVKCLPLEKLYERLITTSLSSGYSRESYRRKAVVAVRMGLCEILFDRIPEEWPVKSEKDLWKYKSTDHLLLVLLNATTIPENSKKFKEMMKEIAGEPQSVCRAALGFWYRGEKTSAISSVNI